jgi:hypothetical protein
MEQVTEEETQIEIDDNLSDEEFEKMFNEQAAAMTAGEPETSEEPETGEEETEEEEENTETDDDEGANEDEVEGEENEDAEQPEEDNSDDTADEDSDQNEADDETADDATEEDPEDDSNTSDEETDGQSTEEDEPTVTTEAQVHKVKANGNEYDFTIEELKVMASKGMNYTQKMQRFAKHKEEVSALEEANITMPELNMMIDVLRSDNKKEAVTGLLKQLGIDSTDLDTDEPINYTPKTYGRSATELGIDEVVENIQGDPEYRTTEHVLRNRLDAESKAYFAENPDQIYILHNDVKSGRYNEISARADKLMQLETGKTKPYVDYYIQAGNEYLKNLKDARAKEEANKKAKAEAERAKIDAEKAKIAKQEKAKEQSKKRKAAGITTNKSAAKPQIKDYLDDDLSDEDFLKMYEEKIKG